MDTDLVICGDRNGDGDGDRGGILMRMLMYLLDPPNVYGSMSTMNLSSYCVCDDSCSGCSGSTFGLGC